jgi:anti-sigma B factor antagonist
MKITKSRHDGIIVTKIEGKIAGAGVDELVAGVAGDIEKGSADLILDFMNVPFVDSRGLEALITLHEKALDSGGAVKIICLREPCATVFRITRMDSRFELYPDEREALISFKKG